MNRLFTFGCSFTNYRWPTWADILGKEFTQFENWGRAGAGNSFIFYALAECIKRNNITADDTVIIMWTSIAREDRWVNGDWLTYGNIYNQPVYDDTFIKTLVDPMGYLIKDLATISMTKKVLESIGCTWHFLSMLPLDHYNDNQIYNNPNFTISKEIKELYVEELSIIKPSIYEVVFNSDWTTRPLHLLPMTSRSIYEKVAGSAWPSFTDYLNKKIDDIDIAILKEIRNVYKIDNHIQNEQLAYENQKNLSGRSDLHPIPSEHLEYIENVLPKFNISDNTKNWIIEINNRIISNQNYDEMWQQNLSSNIKRL